MNRRVLELKDKRGELLDKAEEIINKAKAEKRDKATMDELREINRLQDEAERVTLELKEAELEAKRQADALDAEIRGQGKGGEERTSGPLETRSHRELCQRCDVDPDDMNGWSSPEEFYSALLHRNFDARLYSQRSIAGMSTLVPQDGGAIVPEKVAARILDLALDQEVVRSRARNFPITAGEGRTLRVPLWDTYDRSSGNISGTVKMSIVGEGAAIPTSKPKLEAVSFDLKKGGILIPLTSELLEDAGPSAYADLEAALAAAIAFGRDDLLLNGTGGAQPLGALLSPNKVTITKETGQPAATILYENIVKMESRMLPSSLAGGSATWVAHPSTYPQLRSLALPIGTGGQVMPLLQGSSRGGWTLNGTELVFTEKCPVLGTAGDISLIDFNRYGVALRPGMRMDLSAHIGFETDQAYLRAIVRFDGKSLDPVATTPKNGSTFSSTVTLETRS